MPDTLFRELAENAPVMIWRSGPDRRCDWFNRRWLEFVGEDMVPAVEHDWLAQVHPEDQPAVAEAYRAAFDERSNLSMMFRMQRRDGAWRTVLYNGAPFSRGGVFAGFFGSCTDVSEQQETYQRLEQAYRERDGLLREVYHRVKNNLQQIQGLIAMEAVALNDASARDALLALSGRVQSMGLVHQMLLRSSDLTHVNARDFIDALCKAVGSGAGARRRGIEISVDVEDTDVDIERAVVKGLIINELVANSLKHAFPAGRSGHVWVRFRRTESHESIMEIEDDGIGLDASASKQEGGAHIGMSLVEGLVDQLDGTIEQKTPEGGGCSFRITFPATKGGTSS